MTALWATTGPDYDELAHQGVSFAAMELDASAECAHGRLPGDKSKPCGCWNEARVIQLPKRCWNCGGNGNQCCEYGACAA